MKLLLVATMIWSAIVGINTCGLNRRGTCKDETIHFHDDTESSTFNVDRDSLNQKHVQVKPITAESDLDDIQVQATNQDHVHTYQKFEKNDRINNFDRHDIQRPVNTFNNEYYSGYGQGQFSNYPTQTYQTNFLPTTKNPYKYYPTANYPTMHYPAEQNNAGRLTHQRGNIQGQGFNISAAISNFGITMMQYTSPQANMVMSPFSIATLLALLQQGASGETQQQISAALGMQPDIALTEYKNLADTIKSRHSQHNILNSANSIFVSQHYGLNADFARTATQYFDSEVTSLNFFDATTAANTINGWVSSKTKNNIKQIVSPDSLSENTQLVLANAMYFKGAWQIKFKAESTLPRDFYGNNKQRKSVPFLRVRRKIQSGVDQESQAQVVILPFENKEYSFMAILPAKRSSVSDVLSSLSYTKLAEYHNFTTQDVELEIPKFTIRADSDLVPLLGKMGVTNIFGPKSELFGVSLDRNSPPRVSSAIHTAMLSIDEEGGTAAASTTFTVVALSYDSPDLVFKADKPFIAVLWDTKLSLPLILAKVEDPTP